MKIETKKAKFFYSKDLNKNKFQTIKNKAVLIRDFKNHVSEMIHSSIIEYLDFTKFDAIKKFNTQISGLNGQDIQIAISDVWSCYENRIDQIKKALDFKRKHKKHTELSMVMSFLTKYGCVGITANLKIPNADSKKAIFYQSVTNYLNKFGEHRLLNLALSRRSRIISKKLRLIKFNELSFRTITRINSNLVDFNKNFLSKFNGFVNIGGYQDYKKLSIPTSFNKNYHDEMYNYKRKPDKPNTQSYQIKILDNKRIRIAHVIEGREEIPDQNSDYLGVDTNVKRNLFSTKLGNIDFDRALLTKYVKFLQKIDNKKAKQLNARRTSDYRKWRLRIKNHIKQKMVELIDLAQQNKKNHLVLEELSLMKQFRIPSEFGINYGRLFRLLGLTSIKNDIVQIAHRHGLSVSFVQPEYSSQTCWVCGHISKENRKNQEEFICVSCGHQDDADINSSKNLEWRIGSDVLRQSLLDMNFVGEYSPKSHIKIGVLKDMISNSYQIARSTEQFET